MEEDDVRQTMQEKGFKVVELEGRGGYICSWAVLGRNGEEWAVYAVKYDADATVYEELASLAAEYPDEDLFDTPDPEFVECQSNEFETFPSERQARAAFSAARTKVGC